ncbi:disco-interacting protein 2 homolog A isoform X7 [Canis lupus baileyi]|uniref:disco-interacting protein 2 homolog A isoform X7 n=1 Tax=Canis lupus dingo TaxID=286419 RepID=UPI0015F15111|nr:disco-interacting protein 2 homolog A isoform X7 [Canis lupus dingo]XP_038299677.1 disco-interacting protein 2 homolog A isoform X3 [Canis lupus familiaris]XP_038317614.1 disco-interacting protein 2 homolog A isoform X3 [Canis lupus familiaris]XP_038437642.1 disco-interacting protein 2 homolog A isoform X3 [Canis lupus familiaris]
MAARGCALEAVPLPPEVRESLAELELELSEGDITQKGYEKKRAKLLARYIPLLQGVDPSLQAENRVSGPAQTSAVAPKQQKPRPANSRDERFRSDVHTEAVQAALAKYKERKMPMPSKRRSVLVHSSVETYTPPDTSSASEDEGSLRRPGRLTSTPLQSHSNIEPWLDRVIQGSSTSSSASSTSSHPGGRPAAAPSAAATATLTGPAAHAHIDLHSAPPDVTTGLVELSHCERPQLASVRGVPRGYSGSVLETAGGKLWSRSLKLAYTLLNKLTSKNEPLLNPGDRVALVFPNSDPVMFMVAFYGCLLAELVPVPIEVPLTRKDAGSQQVGFLLGSCGVTLALTTDACQKGLPKAQTGEVATFKGWPPLAWLVIDGKHLTKPPKDWHPQAQDAGAGTAYIEYKTSKEGSTVGVTVSHASLLAQCRALTQACGYSEAETLTNVLDFKRDAGLWHGVLTSVMNRMHVISIPYALMKVNPLSWIQKVCSYKARAALVKSRDMHWSLLAQRGQRDVSLSSLRMLIVADGANPWSISSCDAFLNVFQSRGLRPEVICPCATSPEALTVAIRRPPDLGGPPPRKAVLSMNGLSFGVIRVDTEEKLSVLTVQDVGQVLPGADVCVVKVEGAPYLCKTDEVGEICVHSSATGTAYYGLLGITKSVFETVPLTAGGAPVSERPFTRTGLLGFVGPDDLVFVVGKLDGLMVVGVRRHNADDVVATALAVEPMKFVYRGRIAVFSVTVLHDDRIVLVAEQRPDASEEDSFQWMSRVLQAIDSIHQVGVYCLALVPANTLPKAPLGGIHISETKQRFLEGMLHPCNVLMCPHTCVTNLPKPRQKQPEVGPASMIVGNLVAGKRIAQASGRELAHLEDSDQARKFLFLPDVLQWRAHTTPDHPLFLLLNAKGTVTSTATCVQLHKRAERVAAALMEKARLNVGDHVALVYPPGVDLIAAFYGCLYCGCVPVTVRPPHPQNLATTLPTVKMIVEVSKSACVLTTQAIMRLLKSKDAGAAVDVRTWPTIVDTDDIPKKKVASIFRPPSPDVLAYLDFSVSTTGILAGVKMSHAATSALCRSIKLQCELYPSRQIAICLDPYCGLGFALWCLCSVYSGHQSVLVPPLELESNVSLWLSAVSQYKARVTFCSYSVMEMCTRGLGTQTGVLRMKGVNLSCVRTCMVVAEERPRIALTQSFSKLFKDLGLPARAVSTTFGCRVNVAICLQPNRLGKLAEQGTAGPDPTTVYVDMRALRHDRVRLVERGSPHSLPLTESGKILPGVKVIIAHTETKGPLGDSHLGEIWVSSPHNATGYYTVYGEEALHADHFSARLSFGDTQTIWARTGYLGFLRRTELTDASGERHDALYVVGSLDETLELRGMRYHPIDIETSVVRAHRSIAECAVFTWTNLLVVVVELDGLEQDALDLVALVTNVVLEEHHLVVGVVVIVDPGVIPINSRGEKQRMHLRDGFLADQLDPIYVAYNM